MSFWEGECTSFACALDDGRLIVYVGDMDAGETTDGLATHKSQKKNAFVPQEDNIVRVAKELQRKYVRT